MSGFENQRVEGPFRETYKGQNQFIVSGAVDDLFLTATGYRLQPLPLAEAYREYGLKAGYEIVATLASDLTPEFPNAEMAHLYAEAARAESLPPGGGRGGGEEPDFVRHRRESAQRDGGGRAGASVPRGGDGELERVRKVLLSGKKTLVIVPEAERLIPAGPGDAAGRHRLEAVARGWREIITKADPDTRTVLIVNPHRLEEFLEQARKVSCRDHNVREVELGGAPMEELRAWLEDYAAEENIDGEEQETERVALTGKANAGGYLQNLVSWVRGFHRKHPEAGSWKALLDAEHVDAAESKKQLLEELESMIGLGDVKKAIQSIVKETEQDLPGASKKTWHMMFLGNPGTGKTEVARLVAKLLWAVGLRTSPKVVEAKLQDIASPYNEGDTIHRMKAKVEEAMGGVLFIDEAYQFAASDSGRAALQTLLTAMEDHRRELTVIFAGYEDTLRALKDVNPGIERRITVTLRFKDYETTEKLQIFEWFMERDKPINNRARWFGSETRAKLMRVLRGVTGNAGGVRNVWEKTKGKVNNGEEIRPEHVPDPHRIDREAVEQALAGLGKSFTGMDAVTGQLRRYCRWVAYVQRRAEALNLKKTSEYRWHLRFTGPPGTGKTEVARAMGRFFHAMGITESEEVKECGATELKGAYVGHAQQAVNDLFHENRGKVVFIDEIYSLYNPEAGQNDSFGREAIDTLVRCLTAEENRDTVVIVAGYKDRVDRFMEANPGLASRFPEEIEFRDYDEGACTEIFRVAAEKAEYKLGDGCEEKARAWFRGKKAAGNFGNGRDARGLLGLVEARMAERLDGTTPDEEAYKRIEARDIPVWPEDSGEVTP